MPIVENVHPGRKLVHTVFQGRVTGRDIIAAAKALADHPGFAPDFDQLIDYRLVDSHEASAEELRRVAYVDPFRPTSRRCFLANSDVAFGMARMYQQFNDATHPHILVTREPEEAWAFLALPFDAPERAQVEELIESLRDQ